MTEARFRPCLLSLITLFDACALYRDGAATTVPVTTFEGLEQSAICASSDSRSTSFVEVAGACRGERHLLGLLEKDFGLHAVPWNLWFSGGAPFLEDECGSCGNEFSRSGRELLRKSTSFRPHQIRGFADGY